MGWRSLARGAAQLSLVLAGDAARWGGQKVVGFLFSAPSIAERFPANPGLPEEDEVLAPSDDELERALEDRRSMIASRRPPAEDNPSEEPLVGSIEWRRQQRSVKSGG